MKSGKKVIRVALAILCMVSMLFISEYQKVEVYAAINKKIIGATYWEGDETFDVDKAEWYNLAILANGNVIYTDIYRDVRTGEIGFTVAKISFFSFIFLATVNPISPVLTSR